MTWARCKMCRRVITDAESIRQGIGPTCRSKLEPDQGTPPRRALRKHLTRADALLRNTAQGELFGAGETDAP